MIDEQSIKRKVMPGCTILGAGAFVPATLSLGGMCLQESAKEQLEAAAGQVNETSRLVVGSIEEAVEHLSRFRIGKAGPAQRGQALAA